MFGETFIHELFRLSISKEEMGNIISRLKKVQLVRYPLDFFNLSLNNSWTAACIRRTHRYARRAQSRVKRRNCCDPRAIASLRLTNEIIIKSSFYSVVRSLASLRYVAKGASGKGRSDATRTCDTRTHVNRRSLLRGRTRGES